MVAAWQIRDSDPPPPYTEVANSENAPPPSYFEVSKNLNPLLENSSSSSSSSSPQLDPSSEQPPPRLLGANNNNNNSSNNGTTTNRADPVIPTVVSHHSVIAVPWTYNERRSDFSRNSMRGSSSESGYSNEDGSVEASEKKTIAAYCTVIGLSVFVIFAFWVYTTSANYDTSLFKLTPLDSKSSEYFKPSVKYYPEIISADELALYNITIEHH